MIPFVLKMRAMRSSSGCAFAESFGGTRRSPSCNPTTNMSVLHRKRNSISEDKSVHAMPCVMQTDTMITADATFKAVKRGCEHSYNRTQVLIVWCTMEREFVTVYVQLVQKKKKVVKIKTMILLALSVVSSDVIIGNTNQIHNSNKTMNVSTFPSDYEWACDEVQSFSHSRQCKGMSGLMPRQSTYGKRLSMHEIRPIAYQEPLEIMYPNNGSTTLNRSYDEMWKKIDDTFSFYEDECVAKGKGELWLAPADLYFALNYTEGYFEFLEYYKVYDLLYEYRGDPFVMEDYTAASHFLVCMSFEDYYKFKRADPEHCMGFSEKEFNGTLTKTFLPIMDVQFRPACFLFKLAIPAMIALASASASMAAAAGTAVVAAAKVGLVKGIKVAGKVVKICGKLRRKIRRVRVKVRRKLNHPQVRAMAGLIFENDDLSYALPEMSLDFPEPGLPQITEALERLGDQNCDCKAHFSQWPTTRPNFDQCRQSIDDLLTSFKCESISWNAVFQNDPFFNIKCVLACCFALTDLPTVDHVENDDLPVDSRTYTTTLAKVGCSKPFVANRGGLDILSNNEVFNRMYDWCNSDDSKHCGPKLSECKRVNSYYMFPSMDHVEPYERGCSAEITGMDVRMGETCVADPKFDAGIPLGRFVKLEPVYQRSFQRDSIECGAERQHIVHIGSSTTKTRCVYAGAFVLLRCTPLNPHPFDIFETTVDDNEVCITRVNGDGWGDNNLRASCTVAPNCHCGYKNNVVRCNHIDQDNDYLFRFWRLPGPDTTYAIQSKHNRFLQKCGNEYCFNSNHPRQVSIQHSGHQRVRLPLGTGGSFVDFSWEHRGTVLYPTMKESVEECLAMQASNIPQDVLPIVSRCFAVTHNTELYSKNWGYHTFSLSPCVVLPGSLTISSTPFTGNSAEAYSNMIQAEDMCLQTSGCVAIQQRYDGNFHFIYQSSIQNTRFNEDDILSKYKDFPVTYVKRVIRSGTQSCTKEYTRSFSFLQQEAVTNRRPNHNHQCFEIPLDVSCDPNVNLRRSLLSSLGTQNFRVTVRVENGIQRRICFRSGTSFQPFVYSVSCTVTLNKCTTADVCEFTNPTDSPYSYTAVKSECEENQWCDNCEDGTFFYGVGDTLWDVGRQPYKALTKERPPSLLERYLSHGNMIHRRPWNNQHRQWLGPEIRTNRRNSWRFDQRGIRCSHNVFRIGSDRTRRWPPLNLPPQDLFDPVHGLTKKCFCAIGYVPHRMEKLRRLSNQADASNACTERGTSLPELTGQPGVMTTSFHKRMWVGGKRINSFTWMRNRSTVRGNLFQTGEPNNFGGNEDCIDLDPRGLNDLGCGHSLPVVCDAHLVYFPNASTFDGASRICRLSNMRLANIETAYANNVLNRLLQKEYAQHVWIGMKKDDRGLFRWQDNSMHSTRLPDPSPWDFNEPNNWLGNEACVEAIRDIGWNDRYCNDKMPFVCERVTQEPPVYLPFPFTG